MALKFERKLPIILFAVVVVITLIGVAFYQNTVSLQESVARERRTRQVLAKFDETLRLANDIEAGTRNFVFTGNDTYLEPNNKARQRIGPNIAELKKYTADNPTQTAEIERLEIWIRQLSDFSTQLIDQRKQNGYEATFTNLTVPSYVATTENIRRSVERLKAEELREMEARDVSSERGFARAIWILIIGSLAGIVALGIANLYVSREMNRRRSAEHALTAANKGLEAKVEERTHDLLTANERLELIAAEREELLASEKDARKEAEAANLLRDNFMATVSHELRTPLNSIIGWARMMRDGDLDEARQAKAVGTIIKNSETQKRLIEDLLDVTRIMSGKLELEIESVDPAEIINHSAESVRPAAELKKIALGCSIAPGVYGIKIKGDKNRLIQIFTNLLTNAVKFTPEGGKVDIDAETARGNLIVKVIDNGIGISREFLPQVFERFRQVPGRGGTNGGLGLGLAIVQNLAELHGGSVSVKSAGEGEGSTFIVSLPL